jgi:hypothetical protein
VAGKRSYERTYEQRFSFPVKHHLSNAPLCHATLGRELAGIFHLSVPSVMAARLVQSDRNAKNSRVLVQLRLRRAKRALDRPYINQACSALHELEVDEIRPRSVPGF